MSYRVPHIRTIYEVAGNMSYEAGKKNFFKDTRVISNFLLGQNDVRETIIRFTRKIMIRLCEGGLWNELPQKNLPNNLLDTIAGSVE